MKAPLKLGIAGLGTVGAGLLQLLNVHNARVADHLGRPIKVVAVSARSKGKERGVSLRDIRWVDDPVKLAADPEIELFVELIGGDDGVAKSAVETALAAKKHVVTANKALLAKHGFDLAKLAEKNGVALNFEAAVAGGIPIIKTMREALVGNEVSRVYGILNGTCNYILTKMEQEKRSFADVLKEAQAKGYAEADPTFDVGGFDTAHKLSLLAALAFNTKVAADQIHIEGIETITQFDIEAANELGYRIKLLGVAQMTDSGIEQRVHPTLVPEDSAIAGVSGVTNAVAVDADFAGSLMLVGPGAGAKATASSVMSDIVDIAAGFVLSPFGVVTAKLKPYKRAKLGQHTGAYYVRLTAYDRPGVMAAITKRMAEREVSLESIVQRRPRGAQATQPQAPGGQGELANVVIVTHDTTEDAIRKALVAIESDGKVAEKPQMIRIEQL
ncbi:MAG TPA: homoserine dehydrogenase [Hyphomicrobiaceae bacterium]|nr:homoserine dehydrogenase [Hyphomicrobiaceae bacterium]